MGRMWLGAIRRFTQSVPLLFYLIEPKFSDSGLFTVVFMLYIRTTTTISVTFVWKTKITCFIGPFNLPMWQSQRSSRISDTLSYSVHMLNDWLMGGW